MSDPALPDPTQSPVSRADPTGADVVDPQEAAARAEVPSAEPFRTPAIDALDAAAIPYRLVRTRIARHAEESAALQGIPLGSLLRTILVRRAEDDYVFVLVPGGRRFDWPRLRILLGTNRLSLPDADAARAITGYERGAITPFGAQRAWPVIADASIQGLDLVAIGGGARGVNVHVTPDDLIRATRAAVADITVPEGDSGS